MITYRFLPKNKENIEWLAGKTGTYQHSPSWQWPIMIAENEGHFLAYIEIVNCPVLNFGINPNVATPRLTNDLVAQVKAWSNIQNGNCLVVRPQDPKTKFTDHVMEHLGFQNQKLDLFQAKE